MPTIASPPTTSSSTAMSSSAASPNDPVVVDLTESSGDDGDKEDATPSLFVQKDLVKHEEDSKNTTSLLPASHLFVQKDLVKHLKPHQSKGVQFIWKNCFAKDAEGGCILAHYMGLGKSLTTITTMHTAMTLPCLLNADGSRTPVKSVLALIPANTVGNWEDEVTKWTGHLDKPLRTCSLRKFSKDFRQGEIEKWQKEGGVLFMTAGLFLRHGAFIVEQPVHQPQVLILDEAHTLLKNSHNKIAKMLNKIQTKRRILLTGTPLQNNATEFFQLINFVRPGVIPGAQTEKQFDKVYRNSIEAGLASDTSQARKDDSKRKSLRLYEVCRGFVHRADASCLRRALPDFCDTLLYLQTSVVQQTIMHLYDKSSKAGDQDKNFFRKYHAISPILNHPGCLDSLHDNKWSGDTLINNKNLKKTWQSPKFIILAHILVMAVRQDEKTLVYSKCLKTLNLIEVLLQSSNWKADIGSTFPDDRVGNWKKNKDYLRIDGSTDAGKRRNFVDTFNNNDKVRVFLISSEAGGIGINLTAGTRVVIMDNHFNPTVSSQCVSRAHRYGQDKPVHCYRLAIEGTLESKVYARSENKSSVASGVIDGEYKAQNYTKAETEDLTRIDTLLTCAVCQKKRRLPPAQAPPDNEGGWTCASNQDLERNTCEAPSESHVPKAVLFLPTEDPILRHLQTVVNGRTRRTPLVTACASVHESSSSSRDEDGDDDSNPTKQHGPKDEHEPSAKRLRLCL